MIPTEGDYRIFCAARKARGHFIWRNLAASTTRGTVRYGACSAGSFGAPCDGALSDQVLFGHASP
jgi:hypothetical protein